MAGTEHQASGQEEKSEQDVREELVRVLTQLPREVPIYLVSGKKERQIIGQFLAVSEVKNSTT